MTDREKLIEMMEDMGVTCDVPINVDADGCGSYDIMGADYIADHLIANGVTVQKWIPVTERLPEEDVLVLCAGAKGGRFLGYPRFMSHDGTAYTRVPNAGGGRYSKYWMPLPEPPKE